MAPIKRHKALIPTSRDHHHGLLLCWKIREGLKKGISVQRIKKYTDFFFETQLKPHFAFEEAELFSLLEKDHPMIQRAMEDHEILTQLFQEKKDIESALRKIEQQLQEHIRFEERVLFNEIQVGLSTDRRINLL